MLITHLNILLYCNSSNKLDELKKKKMWEQYVFHCNKKLFWSKLLDWAMKEVSSTPSHKMYFTETHTMRHFHPSLKMDTSYSTHACKHLEFSHWSPQSYSKSSTADLQYWPDSKFTNSQLQSTKKLTSDNSLFLPHYLKHQVYCMLLGPKFVGNVVLGKYEILSWEDWAYDTIPAWTAITFLFVCLYPNKNTHLSVAGQPIFISGHLCPFRSPNLM